MPLPKKANAGSCFERVEVNVWDTTTKKIVFTGTLYEAAKHLSVNDTNIQTALRDKWRIKRRYAIRYKKANQ